MMVLFGLGSSSMIGLGSNLVHDAWIAVLLGNLGGIVLLFFYGIIQKRYPNDHYIKILEKILGKTLGRFIGALYTIYFLYIATLVIRDISELLILYILPQTPMIFIHFLLMLVVSYSVYLGIEVIGRYSELTLNFTVFSIIFYVIALILSGVTDFNNLLPVLEQGWRPVLKTTFPLLVTFPFGEIVVFLMIFPYVNKKDKAIKTGMLAMLTTGLILTLITIGNIITLTGIGTQLTIYPTIGSIRLINIFDIIQRIEGVAVMTFLISSLMKITIYFYSSAIGLNHIYNSENYKKYIIFILIIIMLGGMLIADNYSMHIYIGLNIVPYYIHVPFVMIIPFLLAFIIIITSYIHKKTSVMSL